LGVEALQDAVAEQRQGTVELLGEIAAVSRTQAEVTLRMTAVLERMQGAWAVDGPPEGRHLDDEAEAAIFELVRGEQHDG
jgi:hypothetical protein